MSNLKDPWPLFYDVCEPSTPHPESEPIVRLGFDDYARARAGVNACAGLPTELIEKHGVTRSGISKGVEIIEKQRDDLLAALEKCANLLDCVDTCSRNNFSNLCGEESDDIRKLISAVKGGEA